jgi:hypothetical protein
MVGSRYEAIEQLFAKLKALLRKIAARSVEALWPAIGQFLSQLAPEKSLNYFRNSGYVGLLESALNRSMAGSPRPCSD